MQLIASNSENTNPDQEPDSPHMPLSRANAQCNLRSTENPNQNQSAEKIDLDAIPTVASADGLLTSTDENK